MLHINIDIKLHGLCYVTTSTFWMQKINKKHFTMIVHRLLQALNVAFTWVHLF